MSAWRLVVKELYSLGGTATLQQLERLGHTSSGRDDAVSFGLVTRTGAGTSATARQRIYQITELGRQLVEGRVAVVHRRAVATANAPRSYRERCIRPTWLAALPNRNAIRLQDRPC